jgi:type I restriction enzyme S subunit
MMAFIVDESKGNAEYLCYLMLSVNFGNLANSTALPSLSAKSVGEVVKIFPPTLGEQIAIAAVLLDMDNEISKLYEKLSKYRNIKIGMIQMLLTGKIRLYGRTFLL